MALTVAAYWNSQEIKATFDAVASILYSGTLGAEYGMLLNIMALLGMLTALFAVWVRMRPSEAGNHLLAIVLIFGALLVPKTSVVIEERAGTVTGGPVTVDNVPLALGAFAAFTSQTGDWLRQAFEQVLQPVDALRFAPNGMVFGSRVIDGARNVGISDPALQRDMMAFVRECVNPDLSTGYYPISEFVREPDLWNAIKNVYTPNPGRAVAVRPAGNPNAAPALYNCEQAVGQLDGYLNAEAAARLSWLGRIFYPKLSVADANATIASALPAAEAALLGMGETAQQSVLQKMMINLFRDSTVAIPATLDDPAAVQLAASQAMAEEQALSSYRTMAKIGEQTLPMLRNAIQVLLLALFPLVLPIVVLAGARAGGKVLMTYAALMLWVELWPVLYAVVNFIATSRDVADLPAYAEGVAGFTLANASPLASRLVWGQAMAGLLAISVPFIALAIVMGGAYTASGVVTQLMAPASGAAQSAGAQAGLGNANMGNLAWSNVTTGNTNASHWNTAMSHESGRAAAVAHTGYGSYQTDGPGGAITGMRANRWEMGGSVSGGSNLQRAETDTSSGGVRASTGHSASLDLSSAATSGNRSSAEFSRQMSTALQTRLGQSGQWGQQWTAGSSASTQTGSEGQSTLQNRENQQYSSQLGLKAGVGADKSSGPYGDGGAPGAGSKAGPVRGRLGVGGDIGSGFRADTSQAIIDVATNKSGSISKEDRQHAAQIVTGAVNDVMRNTSDAGVRSAAQSFSADFQQATRASEQRSASVSHDAAAGNSRQEGTTNHLGASFSLGTPTGRELLAMAGGDPAQALRLAQEPNALAAATAAAAGAVQHGAPGAELLGAGGVQAPRTPAQVEAQGNAQVGALAGQARGAVGSAHAGQQAAVAAQQPVSPTSVPDTSPATTGYTGTANAASAGYQALQSDVSLRKGATDAAAALYKAEQQGSGTVLANTFLAGWGYQSPQEYQGALMEAAAARPRLANSLRHIGEGGGKVSPAAMEFIQSEVKAYKDSKE